MERNVNFDASAVGGIDVRMAWAQVEIFADDVDKVQVLAAGDENSVKDLRIEQTNEGLLVEQPQYGLSLNLIDSHWMQVCVRVPQAWSKPIRVNTIGGILNARALKASAITLDTVSGDLRAVRLSAEEIALKTISGDIRSDGTESASLNARTVSGNITLDGACADTVKCTTVSGEQKLRLGKTFRQMDLRSVSGDVTITAPAEKMSVQMRSVSGRVSTDGVEIVESADAPQLHVTAVSADLKLISVKE